MKEVWTLNSERLKQPGVQQRGVHLSMHALYDPPLDRWIDGFLDRWLATDTRITSASAKSVQQGFPEIAAAAS
jgi:GMP synthase (glutamine-hydrolysing)